MQNKNNTQLQRVPGRHAIRTSRIAAVVSSMVSMLTILIFCSSTVESARPPANATIGNQASATYKDSDGTDRTATSNVALTTVAQVAGVDVTGSISNKPIAPGGQVSFPHTIKNTGNGSDTYRLSASNQGPGAADFSTIKVYADANGDGVPDNTTDLNADANLDGSFADDTNMRTPSIPSEGTFNVVIVATVSGTVAADAVANVKLLAQSIHTATVEDFESDSAIVKVDAVINVTKSLSKTSGAPGTTGIQVKLTYNNSGNSAATTLEITDQLASEFEYVVGTARWSVSGTTALTEAAAGDPSGISYSTNGSGKVTAIIGSVAPGQSGTITFDVNIASGATPKVVNNTAQFKYDGQATPLDSNTAKFTIDSVAGVELTPDGVTVADAVQGSTVSFLHTVQNTGTATNSYDIGVVNGNFPNGTTFTLFQANGTTPLVDTTGNGVPDSGPLAPNATVQFYVKANLPAGAYTGPFTFDVTATSVYHTTQTAPFDTETDTLTAIIGNRVDLRVVSVASPRTEVGITANPPDAAAASVHGSTNNPGTIATFTLAVTNMSAVADTYNFSVVSGLPASWSLVFKSGAAVVTGTGVINAGGSGGSVKDFTAEFSIPSGYPPSTNEIVLQVVSPTSTASDKIRVTVVVNTVRSITLTPNNTAQIFAGGSVIYTHTLKNTGNVLEGNGTASDVNLSFDAPSLSGWTSVVYYDKNGNGVIDTADDTIIANTAFLSGAANGLTAGESIALIVKVFAPPGAPIGAINATTLRATTVGSINGVSAPAVAFVQDSTTVISSDLVLTKEQALDNNADGDVADAGDVDYTTQNISGAKPGAILLYRITVKNNGSASANSITVNDTKPAFTTLVATSAAISPANPDPNHADPDAVESSGNVTFYVGTLAPGASSVLTFRVTIDQ